MNRITEPFTLENAQILFRNFAGKEGPYNREGDRNFCVLLGPALAEILADNGWNIKSLKPRDEDDVEQPYLMVSVGYKVRPPKIVLVGSRGKTTLSEENIELVDWVDIKYCDMVIRPYNWSVGAKSGIKAYLKTLFVILDEDDLDIKYSSVQEYNPDDPSQPPWEPDDE